MANEFDFKGVSGKSISYLRPGQYNLTIGEAEYIAKENKTPHINVTFVNKENAKVSEKFYITPKTLNRLQHLHEGFTGKPIEKAFGSSEEIGAYFEKMLTTIKSKNISKRIKVGGQKSEDNKVYAGLPFLDFIIADDVPFEEGEFEPGTARYNEVVTKSKATKATGRNETVLSDDAPDTSDDADNKMPWE